MMAGNFYTPIPADFRDKDEPFAQLFPSGTAELKKPRSTPQSDAADTDGGVEGPEADGVEEFETEVEQTIGAEQDSTGRYLSSESIGRQIGHAHSGTISGAP